MPEQMKFVVDQFNYVVEFENNEFVFYVDGSMSNTQIHNDEQFDGFDFYEEPLTKVLKSSDLVQTKSSLKIYRHVMRFVQNMIGKHKPAYFFFSANEDRKFDLYSKVALQISEKFGYYLQADGKSFYFYKKVD